MPWLHSDWSKSICKAGWKRLSRPPNIISSWRVILVQGSEPFLPFVVVFMCPYYAWYWLLRLFDCLNSFSGLCQRIDFKHYRTVMKFLDWICPKLLSKSSGPPPCGESLVSLQYTHAIPSHLRKWNILHVLSWPIIFICFSTATRVAIPLDSSHHAFPADYIWVPAPISEFHRRKDASITQNKWRTNIFSKVISSLNGSIVPFHCTCMHVGAESLPLFLMWRQPRILQTWSPAAVRSFRKKYWKPQVRQDWISIVLKCSVGFLATTSIDY